MDLQPALLVDVRNALYRAIYAAHADRLHDVQRHSFVILLRQLCSWIRRFRPRSVHIFWDAPRETVWRRLVSPTYKDRSSSDYVRNYTRDLEAVTSITKEFMSYLNCRQYEKKQMEADDLIYAAVSFLHPCRSIIISTDSDMIQIPFHFNSCSVYNPKSMSEAQVPHYCPAHFKALVGDKSDSIDGYFGIGPVKGQALLEDYTRLQRYLSLNGYKTFLRNLLLVDLSLCPRRAQNISYVSRRMSEPVNFSESEIVRLIMKYKMAELMTRFADLIYPFKTLC